MSQNTEKRKNHRLSSIAKARIPKAFSGEALLKDISITGCRIECTMQTEIQEKSKYTITVYPEDISDIGCFALLAECKWIYSGSEICEIGFDIKKSTGKRDFQRYVDYLFWRRKQ